MSGMGRGSSKGGGRVISRGGGGGRGSSKGEGRGAGRTAKSSHP